MVNSKKILIIYNPNAGQKKAKLFRQVVHILKAFGAEIAVIETQYAGHAQIIAKEYRKGPYDIICAAGGDGTLNEVLNGLQPSALAVGIIPLGTANVMAKELNIQETPETISATLLSDVQKGCWLGKQEERYFSLMVSVGTDAKTINDVNLALKKLVGKSAYVLSFLKQILFYRPVAYEVMIDDVPYHAGAVIITKGKYYGGKFICAPKADLSQKEFHVVLMTEKDRWAALTNAVKMVLNWIPQDKSVQIVVGKTITIRSDCPASYQIDGDPGGRLPLTLSLSDTPVSILCGPID